MARRFLYFLLICLNIFVGLGLIAAAWVGTIDPEEHPTIVILTMTFPIWPVLGLLVLIADFFVARKWCVWMSVTFGCALPVIFTVFPLNIKRGDVPQRLAAESWTLLSYNVINFTDITGEYPGGINPGVQYIIDHKPDIALIEECVFLSDSALHISSEQRSTLDTRYPYNYFDENIGIYSRFRAKELTDHSLLATDKDKSGYARAWEIDVHGDTVLFIGVHLRSIGLTDDDKELYRELTKGDVTNRSELRTVKTELIGKLSAANAQRAMQAKRLVEVIDSLNYKNVIISGDFNDVPGCYTLNELSKIGLREVYPLVGNGYMSTFNANRFFFQIDHVLFRGNWRPWSIQRGDLKSSDHYPVLVTFVRDNQ